MSPDFQIEPQENDHRILLVEDDVLLRGLLADMMRDCAFTVVEVASADAARQYLLAGGIADLVISDVEMPGAMNGLQLGRWVRRNYPDIQIILTSGTAAQGASAIGRFFPKPYGMLEIVKAAREMLDAKRQFRA